MLVGLSGVEEQMTVARYFDAFSWEPPVLDPEMAAGDFLDAL